MSRTSRAAQRRVNQKNHKLRQSAEQDSYATAIHEAAHCIVGYAVGSQMKLDEKIALSIVTAGKSRGRNILDSSTISAEDSVVSSFAGCIAERIEFPDKIAKGYGGDASSIFFDCIRMRIPEFDNLRNLNLTEADRQKYINDHCVNFLPVCKCYEVFRTTDDDDELVDSRKVCKDYLSVLHALFNYPPDSFTITHKTPKHFVLHDDMFDYEKNVELNDAEDFELLKSLAARSWGLVKSNWGAIKSLADEIHARKEMSGREVHEFVTRMQLETAPKLEAVSR